MSDQRGFTLVEMLIAMATALVVSAAAMGVFVVLIDQHNQISSRVAAVDQAQAGLQEMTRDLRNAMYETASSQSTYYSVVVTTNASAKTISLVFDVPTPGAPGTGEPVAWVCWSPTATSFGSCTRSVNGGTARQVITGVQSVTLALTDSTGTTTTVSSASSGTTTYPSGSGTPALASVGITLSLADVSQLDTSRSKVVPHVKNPIVIQTTADLRNFA